jgi:hypothetical protein
MPYDTYRCTFTGLRTEDALTTASDGVCEGAAEEVDPDRRSGPGRCPGHMHNPSLPLALHCRRTLPSFSILALLLPRLGSSGASHEYSGFLPFPHMFARAALDTLDSADRPAAGRCLLFHAAPSSPADGGRHPHVVAEIDPGLKCNADVTDRDGGSIVSLLRPSATREQMRRRQVTEEVLRQCPLDPRHKSMSLTNLG